MTRLSLIWMALCLSFQYMVAYRCAKIHLLKVFADIVTEHAGRRRLFILTAFAMVSVSEFLSITMSWQHIRLWSCLSWVALSRSIPSLLVLVQLSWFSLTRRKGIASLYLRRLYWQLVRFFTWGWMAGVWVYSSEICPLSWRSKGMG